MKKINNILNLLLLLMIGLGSALVGGGKCCQNRAEPQSIAGNAYKQFKAYISSGHEFRYYFNGISEAMKGKFQNVFTSKADELFNLNPANNYFRNLGISLKDDLIQRALNLDDPIYNFIK